MLASPQTRRPVVLRACRSVVPLPNAIHSCLRPAGATYNLRAWLGGKDPTGNKLTYVASRRKFVRGIKIHELGYTKIEVDDRAADARGRVVIGGS